MHKLHPGAKWNFRLGVYGTFFVPLVFLGGFLSSVIFKGFVSNFISNLLLILISLILIIVLFGEIYARMAYNRWKFEFTETNLKKEQGIIWKRYSNIPYERVQNVDIQRGIIARIFGFSSVMIHTAGYSGYGGRGRISAEGYIPAVSPEYAEKIRDFLMHKISRKGNTGGL